ncbi:MAG: nitrogenase component 1, partial [Methanobacterium sp.]|nr:nitrogenase component 1 [Methanobacterium sp.]
ELGMEPVLICLDFEGKYTEDNLKEIMKRRNIKPVILKQPDYLDILNLAKNLNADLILGGMGEIGVSSELGIPLIDVMHAQEVTFGFEGAVLLARKIFETLND